MTSSPRGAAIQRHGEDDVCMTLTEAVAEPCGDQAPPVITSAVVLDTSEEDKDVFSPMLKATKAGLDKMNISYVVHPLENNVTAITFKANVPFARDVPFRILVEESRELFILLLSLPTLVPEEHHTIVSKYWTRVNYNLNVGNVEMDFRDGEVRFRVATVVKNTPLSPEMVTLAIDTAVSTTRQHLPGQFHVVYGDMDVETAYHTARNYQ